MTSSSIKNNSHRNILKKLSRWKKENKIISLDIFDTIIFRRLQKPADLFTLLHHRAHSDLLLELPANFSEKRIEAELISRQLARKEGQQETTLNKIYIQLQKLLRIENLDEVKTLEQQLEIECCYGNPFFIKLVDDLLKSEVRVVFTSDIYLPLAVITAMLRKCGYPKTIPLFLSSEIGLTKHTGALYTYVSSFFGCSNRDIVHIGDNIHSDVVQANNSWVNGIHYRAPKKHWSPSYNLRYENISSSIHAGLVYERQITCADNNDNYWWNFGYERVGQFYLGFTQWLIQHIEKNKHDHIYFMARDGHILQRVYNILKDSAGHPESSYLYASRGLYNFPAITKLDDDALGFLMQSYRPLKARQYFSRLGIDPMQSSIIEELQSSEIQLNDLIDGSNARKLRNCFRNLENTIVEIASSERDVLLAYLDNEGITEKKSPAFVDVGWHGSLQTSLLKLFEDADKKISISGYYFGTNERAAPRMTSQNRMEGYLYNLGLPMSYRKSVSKCVELFEFLCTAPHGSIVGLEEIDGTYRPIHFSNTADHQNQIPAQQVQSGALKFIEDWSSMNFTKEIPVNAQAALDPLDRVLSSSSPADRRHIGNLLHCSEFGQLPGVADKMRQTRFGRELKSFWQANSLRGLAPELTE